MTLPRGDGPIPARILLVGEAFGEHEERAREPFVGPSGQELNRILHEAGLMRSEVYCTNVVNARPPRNNLDEWIAPQLKLVTGRHSFFLGKWVLPIVREGVKSLWREIDLVWPNVIVAAGNTALWALAGKSGIMKWRGSVMEARRPPDGGNGGNPPGGNASPTAGMVPPRPAAGGVGIPPHGQEINDPRPVFVGAHNSPIQRTYKVIPVYHPAAILRQWELRAITVSDFKRVKREAASPEIHVPEWRFILRPSFERACAVLEELIARCDAGETWLDFDLETRAGHIACAGISWSRLDAICLPFMTRHDTSGYWTAEQEARVVFLLFYLLTHPNACVRGQNILYDCQYTWRHWHFIPRVKQDTMISHHTMFAGLPKKLDFQASMYAEHYTQWKPDKEVWKEGG